MSSFFLIFNLERKARMTHFQRWTRGLGKVNNFTRCQLRVNLGLLPNPRSSLYLPNWGCLLPEISKPHGPGSEHRAPHHTTPHHTKPPDASCWGKQPMNHLHGERKGNPLQYSCLGNPIDRGAWRATVYGVAKSRTRLSNPAGMHEPPPGPHNSIYSCIKSD